MAWGQYLTSWFQYFWLKLSWFFCTLGAPTWSENMDKPWETTHLHCSYMDQSPTMSRAVIADDIPILVGSPRLVAWGIWTWVATPYARWYHMWWNILVPPKKRPALGSHFLRVEDFFWEMGWIIPIESCNHPTTIIGRIVDHRCFNQVSA